MTWRRGALLFFAALAGALIPLIPTVQVAGAMTAPIELAGGLLRELSLSGPGGNVLAWALVLLAAGLPLLLLVLPPNRGRRHWEDALLPISSLLLIGLAFCLVNPTWQPSPIFPEVWMLAAFGIWEMGLVSWLVLRLLRGLEEGTMEKVSAVLRVLLVGCAALLVFAAALHGSRAVAAAVDGPAPEQIAMGQLITGGPFDRGRVVGRACGSRHAWRWRSWSLTCWLPGCSCWPPTSQLPGTGALQRGERRPVRGYRAPVPPGHPAHPGPGAGRQSGEAGPGGGDPPGAVFPGFAPAPPDPGCGPVSAVPVYTAGEGAPGGQRLHYLKSGGGASRPTTDRGERFGYHRTFK